MEYERGINLTVRDLRECLEGLPDDMDVIIPIHEGRDENVISGFRHVRTVGKITSTYEPKPALCIATSRDGADMYTLLELNKLGAKCDWNLF